MNLQSTDQSRRIDYLRRMTFEHEIPLMPYPNYGYPAGDAHLQIVRLELEKREEKTLPLEPEDIRYSLERMRNRVDCADFDLTVLVRMLYRYPDSELLSCSLRKEIQEEMLRFTYWVDEPGCSNMIFSTENHQIMYHANELLVGSLWPDTIFSNNGQTGEWHANHAKRYISKWLDWRLHFGFSEWNSNGYYDENIIALLNLCEFAPDAATRKLARRVIDIMMLHMAVNSLDGVFGSPHGRSYARMLLNPPNEHTHPLFWMAFGTGSLTSYRMGTTLLACSDYVVPDAIAQIAQDTSLTFENRERHSLLISEAKEYGIDPQLAENLMFFWGCQNFHHREIIDLSLAACPPEHLVEYPRIEAAHKYYHASEDKNLDWVPTTDFQDMPRANIYTYRTPGFMLSCAQDFRKGEYGWQAHVWQATLSDWAVVYTTHPGAEDTGKSRPDYWHGNGITPRAAAYKNSCICLYRSVPPTFPADHTNPLPEILARPAGLDMTHAFFPQYAFDEMREENNWTMGRVGNTYVGLWSMASTKWAAPQKDVVRLLPLAPNDTLTPYELVADGRVNAWICELGDADAYDSFDAFCQQVSAIRPQGDTSALRYTSPTLGKISFGWDEDLVVDDTVIDLGPYPRIDNPFCKTQFVSTTLPIEYDITYGSSNYQI